MHRNPDNLKTMVSKVKHWLIRKQWRKVIYGAVAVQKCKENYNNLTLYAQRILHVMIPPVSRKIKYRESNAMVLQSWMRMQLVAMKYRPRYTVVVRACTI